jgi:hypothetical protein
MVHLFNEKEGLFPGISVLGNFFFLRIGERPLPMNNS